jgi:hypothetical protein
MIKVQEELDHERNKITINEKIGIYNNIYLQIKLLFLYQYFTINLLIYHTKIYL